MTGGSVHMNGRAVVFRTAAMGYKQQPPRVGMVIGETDEAVMLRVACGRHRYSATAVKIPRELVARDATAREVNLGYPVEAVPPRKVVA